MALPLRFDDLPDDMITEILSRLPNEELFRIESVSKSVQRSVRRVLNRVEAIACQLSYEPLSLAITCDHISPVDDVKTVSVVWDKTPPTSVVALLKRCPEVKCLDLCLVDDIDILTMIVQACPQLECLYMLKIKSGQSKWKSFVDFVGQRLRHLSLTIDTKRLKTVAKLEMLVKACIRLERCHLDCHHNSLDKLMSLKCLNPDQTVLSLQTDRPVLNVSNRIEGLTVNYSNFSAIADRDDNKLDQLQELTLCSSDSNDNIPPIEFSALDTLRLFGSYIPAWDVHLWNKNRLLQLAECRFPKLRTLHFRMYNGDEEAFKTLFKKLKNLKRLIFDNVSHDSLQFALRTPGQSLAALTQLETVVVFLNIFKDRQLPSVIAMVETMAEMKTVKKVRMRLGFESSILILENEMQQLARGVGRLKKWADKVMIELVYVNYDEEEAQQQLDDWSEAFRLHAEVKRIQKRQEIEDESEDDSDDESDDDARHNYSHSKKVAKLVIWV